MNWFDKTLTVLAIAGVVGWATYLKSSSPVDRTTAEFQEGVRVWCAEKKVCSARVIYDYPSNPYVYWAGKKVYLNK